MSDQIWLALSVPAPQLNKSTERYIFTADFKSMRNCQKEFGCLYLLASAGWDPEQWSTIVVLVCTHSVIAISTPNVFNYEGYKDLVKNAVLSTLGGKLDV